jgi:hypothetical protein
MRGSTQRAQQSLRWRLNTYPGAAHRVAGKAATVSGLMAMLLLLGACASSAPPPNPALVAARAAIANAERADASRYAGAELGAAREQLAAADAAVAARDMTKALYLAEQARVEAELAYARSETAKAVAINAEMQRSADALIDELQRRGDLR